MEIQFPPELEARIQQMATASGSGPDQVVVELVSAQISTRVDYDNWFRREVEKGIASLDRGEFHEHAEVGRRMEKFFTP
jgi:predicted transcriptional regulator